MTEPRIDRERFRHGPPRMAPRANPCTKGTGPICRLPLPTLTYSTRGYKPWRPDAVSGTDRHYTEPGPDRGLPCQGDFVQQPNCTHAVTHKTGQVIPGIQLERSNGFSMAIPWAPTPRLDREALGTYAPVSLTRSFPQELRHLRRKENSSGATVRRLRLNATLPSNIQCNARVQEC